MRKNCEEKEWRGRECIRAGFASGWEGVELEGEGNDVNREQHLL